VIDISELGFYFINASAPFSSVGDMALFSQPMYADLESRQVLGMVYGSCSNTQVAESNACTVQVMIDDYEGLIGGWNYMGTVFEPVPSTELSFGVFDIASFRGGFLNSFEYGTVRTFAVEGGAAGGIGGEACLAKRHTPLPEIEEPAGTGEDGNACDVVVNYVSDNSELGFYLINASAPFSSTGDLTHFSQPIYADLESREVIGSAYGSCVNTKPVVSNYCTVQVFLDGYEGLSGGWNHIGTLLNPFPSETSPAGYFDIASFRGEMANNFSYGTVRTFAVDGGVAGGIGGEACLRFTPPPAPDATDAPATDAPATGATDAPSPLTPATSGAMPSITASAFVSAIALGFVAVCVV
jgi:hypothetical protein